MAKAKFNWTDARVSKLRDLMGRGFTSKEVAAKLGGGISRESVIAKAARLGLSWRSEGDRIEITADERTMQIAADSIDAGRGLRSWTHEGRKIIEIHPDSLASLIRDEGICASGSSLTEGRVREIIATTLRAGNGINISDRGMEIVFSAASSGGGGPRAATRDETWVGRDDHTFVTPRTFREILKKELKNLEDKGKREAVPNAAAFFIGLLCGGIAGVVGAAFAGWVS